MRTKHVEKTIQALKDGKEYWPIYTMDGDKIRLVRKHTKLEWAYIFTQIVSNGSKAARYVDFRSISYYTGSWYDKCYHNDGIREGNYPYIPFYPDKFYKLIKKYNEELGISSFLDVGAGYGDKVLLANQIIKGKCDGIELVKEYIRVAKSFGINLINRNAFEFDKYKDYDLIYMYHPIYNEELYHKLVYFILHEMKVGGYFLEVYDIYHDFLAIAKALKSELKLKIVHHDIEILVQKVG